MMTGTVLERSLYSVLQRLQKLRILRCQAACWLVLLVPAMAVTLWMQPRTGLIGPDIPVVLGATFLGILFARLLTRQPSRTEAARLIEQADPELNDAILTAVQVVDRPGTRPSVLAAMAIEEADHLARNRDWSGAVPARQIAKWTLLSFLSFLMMVSSVMGASRYGRNLLSSGHKTIADDERPAATPVSELIIEPGNTEIERGAALTVVARFPGTVPSHAVLEYVDAQQTLRQMTMTETVDSGVFAARMEEIVSDGSYRVLYNDSTLQSAEPELSPSFEVKTYVRPELNRVDAAITPPTWSGRPQETIEDVMRLTVTEGSAITLRLFLNKPVVEAELRSENADPIVLLQTPADATVMETTVVASESTVWSVHLQDSDGRSALDAEKISIKVTRNEPARIKATFPGRDTNVSPLQEFLVEAKASDDFAIVDFGVQYSLSGGNTAELSLKSTADAQTSPLLTTTISHQIALEPLKAAPDDLVTYSFWATDLAADGTERRTYSDIMFAEVRRFEEIFRESQQAGQQPQQPQQQGSQQQSSAVDGVLKLQKEIISATWNTIRKESAARRDGSFTQDVETIAESQGQASEQLLESVRELQGDPKVTELAGRAMEEMTAAREKLESVRDAVEGARLTDAMPLEQSIVQTLLKMRAAEFQVQQQQQQQGGSGGGSSASQQQLQQLELDNNRNRYESEQQARQQQERTEQQREQLQVLNRLKELARRQQMVNERLKQLESELRSATTEKERQEIERELKRLRDEQREMLRDVDELAERMDKASDPQKPESPQLRQQMEAARDNVQQASRAMDDGRLADAISEGTRAERQFDDLKEEFRNQTSSQFDEAVRDLRDQARDLSDREEKLSKQLAGVPDKDGQKNQKPSLKSDRNREQLQKDFGEQRDRLNRVVEQTRQMIEQSEQSEPLLSNKLYDTLRELKDSRPEEALEATEFLAGRGMWSQSQEAEQAARRGIEQLQKGIERAADSILGSEAESLRRAQSQLQEATTKLASEVQAATGEDAAYESSDDAASDESGDQYSKDSDSEAASDNGEQSAKSNAPEKSRRPGQRGQQKSSSQEKSAAGGSKTERQPGEEPGQPQEGDGQSASPEDTAESQNGQPGESDSSDQKSGSSQRSGQKGQSGQKRRGDQEGSDPTPSSENSSSNSETPDSDQKGEGESGGESASEGEQGSRGEQNQDSKSGGQGGQRQKGQQQQGQAQSGQRSPSSLLSGGREGNSGPGANNVPTRPLTGDDFGEWSDQLRDIEEMLDDPELRNRVAQVRDRARAMRAEFKRHGEMPQWDLVKSQLLGEMLSLQQRINQEVAKLNSDHAMVPIDREPVPEQFDSLVQRYYELLGQKRNPNEPLTNQATSPTKR